MKKAIRVILSGLVLAALIALLQVPALNTSAEGELVFQLDGDVLVKYQGTAKSVTIPTTVREIGDGAFAGNSTLKSVKIPSSVEEIDYGAFYGCTQLKGITIPNSVVKIETGAFAECPKLKSVKVGSGVKDWGYGVFAGDTAITNFKIVSGNKYFKAYESVVYDKDGKTLVEYIAGKKTKEYTIPYGVETIYPYAFWGADKLERVNISGKVYEIGAYAFSNCNGLENVYFSPSVKNIDRKAFENCVSLDEVKLPLYVETIHETAFDGCENLELNGGANTVGTEYAKKFNSREREYVNTLEEIERKYESLQWGTNTEGARTPESTVVEGNGPVKDSEGNVSGGSTGNVSNGSVIINNPEGSSGGGTGSGGSDSGSTSGSSSSEDFGRLLGSTRVVDDKAVVLIKNPKVNN